MEEKRKNFMKEIIMKTIETNIEDMSYASLYLLWFCFVNKTLSHIHSIFNLLDFMEEVAKLVPEDMGEEITRETFKIIDTKLTKNLEKELLSNGVNPNDLINMAEKSKKEKSKETKVYEIENIDEFIDVVKKMFEEMEESVENAD